MNRFSVLLPVGLLLPGCGLETAGTAAAEHDAGQQPDSAVVMDGSWPDSEADSKDAPTETTADAHDASNETADATSEDAGPEDAEAGPPGPCDGVTAAHAAVSFMAPSPHTDGFVGFAAWIDEPDFSGIPDTVWFPVWPGCVSLDKTDATFRCDFGPAPESAKIHFITGIHPDQATPATVYFTDVTDGGYIRVGVYAACLGTKPVGTFANGQFADALAVSDDKPQNMMFTVPAP